MDVIVKGQPSIEIGFETKVIQVGGLGDIDSSLSTESENPVMNKVVTAELNQKATKTELSALETKVTETDTKLTELSEEIGKKQDTITDLETIRSGAAKGATALQSVPATYATKTDVSNAIAAAITTTLNEEV